MGGLRLLSPGVSSLGRVGLASLRMDRMVPGSLLGGGLRVAGMGAGGPRVAGPQTGGWRPLGTASRRTTTSPTARGVMTRLGAASPATASLATALMFTVRRLPRRPCVIGRGPGRLASTRPRRRTGLRVRSTALPVRSAVALGCSTVRLVRNGVPTARLVRSGARLVRSGVALGRHTVRRRLSMAGPPWSLAPRPRRRPGTRRRPPLGRLPPGTGSRTTAELRTASTGRPGSPSRPGSSPARRRQRLRPALPRQRHPRRGPRRRAVGLGRNAMPIRTARRSG
jgi:hypothetical protein